MEKTGARSSASAGFLREVVKSKSANREIGVPGLFFVAIAEKAL